MDASDGLRQLETLDVVYLTLTKNQGEVITPTTVYRGRLHQALDNAWVFNVSLGQNGVQAIILGDAGRWYGAGATDTPADGLVVTITYMLPAAPGQPNPLVETATLRNVIPSELVTD